MGAVAELTKAAANAWPVSPARQHMSILFLIPAPGLSAFNLATASRTCSFSCLFTESPKVDPMLFKAMRTIVTAALPSFLGAVEICAQAASSAGTLNIQRQSEATNNGGTLTAIGNRLVGP
jgi:hypothetical protein